MYVFFLLSGFADEQITNKTQNDVWGLRGLSEGYGALWSRPDEAWEAADLCHSTIADRRPPHAGVRITWQPSQQLGVLPFVRGASAPQDGWMGRPLPPVRPCGWQQRRKRMCCQVGLAHLECMKNSFHATGSDCGVSLLKPRPKSTDGVMRLLGLCAV